MNANPQLIEYIQKSREYSLTDEEIKKKLSEVGWPENLVEEAFQELSQKAETEPTISEETTPEETPVSETPTEEAPQETTEENEEIEIKPSETTQELAIEHTETPETETTETPQEEPQQPTQEPSKEQEKVEEEKPIETLTTLEDRIKTQLEQPKTKPSKKILIISMGALVVVAISLVGLYFFKPEIFTFKKPILTPLQPVQPAPQPEVKTEINTNILAYTTTNEDTGKMSLSFYDTNKKEQINLDSFLQNENNKVYDLGPWSPTGLYLPILGIKNKENTRESTVTIYLYDSSKKESKKVYSYPINGEPSDIAKSLQFSTKAAWIEEGKLKIKEDMPIKIGSRLVTYVTPEGKIENSEQPKNTVVMLNDISYQIDPVTKLIAGTIKVGTTELKLELKNTDEILGKLQDNLVVLQKPTAGKSTVKFYTLGNNSAPTDIDLSEGIWKTQTVLINESRKSLIAHQVDNEIRPTQERFIQVNPFGDAKIKVIYGQDISTVFQKAKASFFLSNDGNWIISERRYASIITSGNDFYMKNIDSGQEATICSGECTQMSAFYKTHILNIF